MKNKIVLLITVFVSFLCQVQAGTTTFDHNVTIQDGNIYDVVVVTGNNTVVEMTGGQITGGLFAYNASTVNISGGTISQNVKTFHSSSINISGGRIYPYYIYAYNDSKLNISGEADIHEINAWDSSYVNISGGAVYRLSSGYSASVNIIGGQITNQLSASSLVSMNILGGNIELLNASQDWNASPNVYGGSIQKLASSGGGKINFYGSDFQISYMGGCNGFGEMTGIFNNGTTITACLLASDTYKYLIFHSNISIPPICINRPIGDINYDCKVNMLDLALLVSNWLDCGFDSSEACWK
ncbi:MAG: hypothetical protein LLF92_09205 [Planctomycetaceae bacterium]|nr:hypothetical protein [Planctomycetaceae bacterium]